MKNILLNIVPPEANAGKKDARQWFESLESYEQDAVMLEYRLENNLYSFDTSNKIEFNNFLKWIRE